MVFDGLEARITHGWTAILRRCVRKNMAYLLACCCLLLGGTTMANEVHAVVAPLDDTDWLLLKDSLGVDVVWYETPIDSSVLDSMHYECISEARRGGLQVGFWKRFDTEKSVNEQYQVLRQFAISDSADMIPMLVLPAEYSVDSLQRCLDSCCSYFGRSPSLCLPQGQELPEQFKRYNAVWASEEADNLLKMSFHADSLDDLRRHYPRWRYFEDSVSVPDMIDVSHWQGEINWEKVYASGVRYAYIKCSQGKDLADKIRQR